MLLKERSESNELLILRCLNTRMKLSDKEKYHYLNLERGYEGEIKFDNLANRLLKERYHIHDLQLDVQGSYVQIDSVILSQGVIHIIDVKNFHGDCYVDSDKFLSVKSHREFKNPVIQLKRSATLLRQLLQTLKYNYLVDTHVVFINPEFTLYQAPLDQPYILPSQLNRFINTLSQSPSKLNERDKKLAHSLLSLHQNKNPFETLPTYTYEDLQKGIYCKHCRSFLVMREKQDLICKNCKSREKLDAAIVRNTEEYKVLFPNQTFTTSRIFDWCDIDIKQGTISRILNKHFTRSGKTSDSCYE